MSASQYSTAAACDQVDHLASLEQALAADLIRVESETAAVTVSELSGKWHKVKNCTLR